MAMNNYHELHELGTGSYGKVYKGRRKYTAEVSACHMSSFWSIETIRDVERVAEW